MVRIYADFNDRTGDGACWNLYYKDDTLAARIDELGLGVGDRVTLFQDGDFTVEATLRFDAVDVLDRRAWLADPLWSTVDYLDEPDQPATAAKVALGADT